MPLGPPPLLGLFFRRAAECRESLLGAGQVSRLQSLPNRFEILLALADQERITIGFGAVLAELDDFVVGGLRPGQIAVLKGPSELLQICATGLKILQLLADRNAGNSGC